MGDRCRLSTGRNTAEPPRLWRRLPNCAMAVDPGESLSEIVNAGTVQWMSKTRLDGRRSLLALIPPTSNLFNVRQPLGGSINFGIARGSHARNVPQDAFANVLLVSEIRLRHHRTN
jgi:hypothetical protein